MATNHVGQVGGHHRGQVNHRVSLGNGFLACAFLDPDRIDAIGGLLGGNAGDGSIQGAGVDGKKMMQDQIAPGQIIASEFDDIFPGLELHIVLNVDGRYDDADILGNLTTNGFYAFEQLTVLLDIHQWNQSVSDFQGQNVQGRQRSEQVGPHILFFGFHPGIVLYCPPGSLFLYRCDGIAQPPHNDGEQHERTGGQPRDQSKGHQNGRCNHQCPGTHKQLRADFMPHAAVRSRACHDDAGGGGNDQGRHLTHQPVSNGQERIILSGIAKGHIILKYTDGKTTDDVDQRNNDTCHSIAAHELIGTVHGAIILRFLGNLRSPFAGFVFIDAGIQIGIDAHLLARHGIQCKTRGYLGDSPGAFGDYHKIDHHKDEEHDHADNIIAANNKIPEGHDDLAGCLSALVAAQQNQTR